MASNPELVHLNEDDKKKLLQEKQQNKWSVQMFGKNVPIWVIVVVVIALVFVLHKTGYLNTIEKKAVEFSDGTRRMLDKVSRVRTTSPTSPVDTSPVGPAARVGPASEAVKQQLRQLFNRY